jgi:TolB-like protein
VTFRPEFNATWMGQSHVVSLMLNRLGEREAAAIIAGLVADGMVEEIITALSRIRWLFVIARNSSFTYKGQSVDVKQVSRELGVRYVLEGSVRKGGNRVRITGQLIQSGPRIGMEEGPLPGIGTGLSQ